MSPQRYGIDKGNRSVPPFPYLLWEVVLLCMPDFLFLTRPSITDFEINAILNQDSHRLLKFVSGLVSIFDTG